MKKSFNPRSILSSVGVLFVSAFAGQLGHGATNQLQTGSTWNTTTDWSLGHTPTTTDALLITASPVVTSSLDNSYTAQTLSFNTGGSTINVNANASGTTAQTLTLTGGTNALGGTDVIALSNTTTGTVNMGVTGSLGTITLALGSTGGNINLGTGGGKLILGSSALLTGSGNLSVSGAGTLTLNSSDAGFTGNVTVNSGTLKVTSTAGLGIGNTVAVASGATFDIGNNTSAKIAGLNDVSGAGGTVTNSSGSRSLTVGGSGNYVFDGQLTAGTGFGLTVALTGSGSQTLTGANTYANGTILTTGTLTIANSGSGTVGTANNALGSGTVSVATGSTLQLLNDGAGGTGTGTVTFGNNATVTGGTIYVNDITSGVTNKTLALGTLSIGNITMNVTGGNGYSLGFGAVTGSTATGNSTFNPTTANLILASFTSGASSGNTATVTLDGTSSGNAITGLVANSTLGTTALTKSNSSTWTLSGANTYTGATTLTSGTLVVANAGATTNGAANNGLSTSAVSIAATGVLQLLNDGAGGTGTGTVNFGNNVTINGSGATINVNDLTSGVTNKTLALGNLTIGNIALNVTGGNGYTLGLGTVTMTPTATSSGTMLDPTTANLTVANITGSATALNTNAIGLDGTSSGNSVTGVISNSAAGTTAVNKTNTSTWTLSGLSTYTGPTTIENGTLVAGSNVAVSTNGAFGNAASAIALGDTNSITNNLSPTLLIKSGGLSVGRAITVGSAATATTGVYTIGGANTTGTSTYTSNIILNQAVTLSAATGGVTDFNTGAWTSNNKAITVGSTGNAGTVQIDNNLSTTGGIGVNFGTLRANGLITSTVGVASGAALGGTGSTGVVTLSGTGGVNLTDSAIGTLTVGGLTTAGGGSLTFEIQGVGGTTTVDKISDTGALTISGVTTVNIANVGGLTQSLTNGLNTYALLTFGTGSASLSNFSLATPTLDSKNLSLALVGNTLYLNIGPTATATSYTLATVAASAVIHAGGSTALTTTLTNTGTGTADSIDYSGVGASTSLGTITPGSSISGNLANGNASVSNTANTLTTTTGTSGTATISSNGSLTNHNVGGTPSGSPTGTTVTVYTGQGVWTGAGSTASYGTVVATPTNWTAAGGTPGLDAGFTGVDTATFGAVAGGTSTDTVTLDGSSPNLNAINFTTATRSYNLSQGTGGAVTLSGTTPSINVTAGSHIISAPVVFGATTSIAAASGTQLTVSGAISGSAGLNNTGAGATILSGANTYTGTTAISSGTVYVNNTSGSGTGIGAVTVSNGATLAGSGTIKPTGGAGVTISNGATLASGSNQTAYATANGGNGAVNGTGTGGGLTLDNTEAYSSLLNIAGGGKLTFALGSTTAFNGGSGALNFASPNTDSTYLNITGSTVDQIFATSTTALTINLVDLTSGNTPGGVALTLRSQNPYLLIQTALGTNADFANLVTTGGTGVNGYVLGVSNGLGGYTAFNLGAYDINGNQINTSTNLEGLKLYLYNGDLEVVPEPGTWALMIGGLALLVVVQRRRKNS